jgi:hypothetical protein
MEQHLRSMLKSTALLFLSVLPTWSHSTDQALDSMCDDVPTHILRSHSAVLVFTAPDAHYKQCTKAKGSTLLLLGMLFGLTVTLIAVRVTTTT